VQGRSQPNWRIKSTNGPCNPCKRTNPGYPGQIWGGSHLRVGVPSTKPSHFKTTLLYATVYSSPPPQGPYTERHRECSREAGREKHRQSVGGGVFGMDKTCQGSRWLDPCACSSREKGPKPPLAHAVQYITLHLIDDSFLPPFQFSISKEEKRPMRQMHNRR